MYGKTPVRNLIIQIEEDKQYAKQCALVAVDEIIITRTSGVEFFYYWNEVKKEIQNL